MPYTLNQLAAEIRETLKADAGPAGQGESRHLRVAGADR